MKKVCINCKHNFRWEDDLDEPSGGKRIGYRCSHPKSPVVATVVERSSNLSMREEDAYVYTFGCRLWERK